MVTQSDYSEAEVQACLSVLLEIMTVLGEFREDIVVVGGNVPPLLIPNATEKHPGTLDVDLAIDFRHVGGGTYRTILESLTERDYYQKERKQPFIFYRDVGDITVEINLLSGEYGGSGRRRRHQRVQDIKARKARGCDLVFENTVRVSLEGRLPSGAENKVTLKVPAVGPFLIMKGMALWTRIKEKDPFDVYYCCKQYPGGLPSLARDIRPLVRNKLAKEGLGKIKAKFATVDGIGPTSVADFLEISDPAERAAVKREAFELVNALMNQLGIAAFSD